MHQSPEKGNTDMLPRLKRYGHPMQDGMAVFLGHEPESREHWKELTVLCPM